MTFEQLRLSNQLCFPLYAASRRVIGEYAPFLSDIGLTYPQYLVMLVLWEKDGMSVGEIGGRLMLDTGTLSPLLKTMQAKRLIVRNRSEKDERMVVVSLTSEGSALEEKAKDIPMRVGRCLGLSPSESLQLYKLLYKVIGEDEPAR